jgi:hypothetical protein
VNKDRTTCTAAKGFDKVVWQAEPFSTGAGTGVGIAMSAPTAGDIPAVSTCASRTLTERNQIVVE